jgi:HD-GYP domain-containing protein (c-di-GMP phosphodiesterase class II)
LAAPQTLIYIHAMMKRETRALLQTPTAWATYQTGNIAIRISLYFFIAGTLWVVFSDAILDWLSSRWPSITAILITKGLLFVAAISILIYVVIHRWEERLQASVERETSMVHAMTDAISAMLALRDPSTSKHLSLSDAFTLSVARAMHLPDASVQALTLGAKLHDVGYIGFPAEIISKPSALSEPERSLMQSHPQLGYDLLKNAGVPSPVPEIVLQHHERLDGSGYPHHLKGDEIIPEARIIAVVDVVVAMASHRPYRPAHTIKSILEELRQNRGIKYDAGVVDVCMYLLTNSSLIEPQT